MNLVSDFSFISYIVENLKGAGLEKRVLQISSVSQNLMLIFIMTYSIDFKWNHLHIWPNLTYFLHWLFRKLTLRRLSLHFDAIAINPCFVMLPLTLCSKHWKRYTQRVNPINKIHCMQFVNSPYFLIKLPTIWIFL